MLSRLVIALMFFSLSSSANAMTLLLKDYKAPKDQTEKMIFDMYFDGVREGVIELNAVLRRAGRPLFCQALNLALTDEQAEDIMMREAQTETNPGLSPIGIILIAGLVKTFPCNEKH